MTSEREEAGWGRGGGVRGRCDLWTGSAVVGVRSKRHLTGKVWCEARFSDAAQVTDDVTDSFFGFGWFFFVIVFVFVFFIFFSTVFIEGVKLWVMEARCLLAHGGTFPSV